MTTCNIIAFSGQPYKKNHAGNKYVQYKWPQPDPDTQIWFNAPPFVTFTYDANLLDMYSIKVDLTHLKFDENQTVVAIPWTLIFNWINIVVPNRVVEFLQKLTISSLKKDLCKSIPSRKRKRKNELTDFTTFQCSHKKHVTLCATSTILTQSQVDKDYFETWTEIVCKKCAANLATWSGDGFFYAEHAKPLLKHLQFQVDEHFSILVNGLLAAFTTTKFELLFFKYFNCKNFSQKKLNWTKKIEEFQTRNIQLIFTQNIELQIIDPIDFGLNVKPAILKKLLAHALLYRIFGTFKFNLLEKIISTQQIEDLSLLPKFNIDNFSSSKFRLVVISVFDLTLVKKIFIETEWISHGFVHAFRSDNEKLSIPGVNTIPFSNLNLYLQENPNHTVVAWPANFYTVNELQYLQKLKQQIILAGVPHVIGKHATFGQPFLEMLNRGDPFTFYGPGSNLSLSLEGKFGDELQQIPTSILSSSKQFKINCPILNFGDKQYYNRFLLFTLLYNFPFNNSTALTILPGPQIISTDTEFLFASNLI